jgi:HprK-related kinase A
MKLANLSKHEFSLLLAGSGMPVRFGPFSARVVSNVPELAEPLFELYWDFPLLEEDDFVDFDVGLYALARWFPGQSQKAAFFFDNELRLKRFDRRLSLAFLEWGLNWCVYANAHQYLIFHAAVVERGGKALMLAGVPGAGKSTLCAGLINSGWRLLSDELALIDPKSGDLLPLARPVSLKNRSIEIVRAFAPEAVLGPEIRETHKGKVAHLRPPKDSVARFEEPAMPAWIVFPRYLPDAETTLTPLSKARAFFRLAGNSFNYDLLHAEGFELTSDLVKRCACYELHQSSLEGSLALLDGL